MQTVLTINSHGRGIIDITAKVIAKLADIDIDQGLCHCFCQHTSAALLLCENADSRVKRDFDGFMTRLVSDGDPRYTHTDEGEDDMAAHIRTGLLHSDLTIPIMAGKLALGTWQGICLYEHRYDPHQRRIIITTTRP
ncbi:MAG: YjbQ family protein [Gammaproteobacteria bacterium]|nr:YjbQ family protein [Gammaproteobacteria bacterium]